MENFKPDLIICSGWTDRVYLKISRYFNSQGVSVVLCFDNKWVGSFKQYVATFISRFILLPVFTFVWVPGKQQKEFALRLGFCSENIKTGLYVGDIDFFNSIYESRLKLLGNKLPNRFIYIGRYYAFKGLEDLWNAFIQFSEKNPDWELWCVGTGSLFPLQHPKIRHFGFLQPEQIHEVIAEGGIFVLPSRSEPWGVVVHEMAAAGFPLLLSSEVGAAELFLENGVNGFTFETGNVNSCYLSLCKFAEMNQDELNIMSENSFLKSKKITVKNWIKSINSFLIGVI